MLNILMFLRVFIFGFVLGKYFLDRVLVIVIFFFL